jgi:hypothetical protein
MACLANGRPQYIAVHAGMGPGGAFLSGQGGGGNTVRAYRKLFSYRKYVHYLASAAVQCVGYKKSGRIPS